MHNHYQKYIIHDIASIDPDEDIQPKLSKYNSVLREAARNPLEIS